VKRERFGNPNMNMRDYRSIKRVTESDPEHPFGQELRPMSKGID
jgi:hypothetical protein